MANIQPSVTHTILRCRHGRLCGWQGECTRWYCWRNRRFGLVLQLTIPLAELQRWVMRWKFILISKVSFSFLLCGC
jgi:hypothetical protein